MDIAVTNGVTDGVTKRDTKAHSRTMPMNLHQREKRHFLKKSPPKFTQFTVIDSGKDKALSLVYCNLALFREGKSQ